MRIRRHAAVADGIAEQIKTGALPAGTRLPTHRALAARHGIAVATASRVYRDLTASGLVVGEPGRGTFVRDLSGFAGLEPARLAAGQRTADLSFNQPLSTGQDDELRQALRGLAAEGDLTSLLYQQPPGGRSRDCAAIASYLLGRGIDVAPHSVLITGGAQQGLDALLVTLAEPRAVVAVDALTYPGIKLLATARHLDLAAVRADTTGMDLDHLEWLCGQRPISMLYLIPTLHNPLGYILGASARERIAALAARHDFHIIEDATYAFLEPAAPPPVQTLTPERTFYIGSMSKNLASGLRIGYVVAPLTRRPALIRSLRATSWGASSIASALTTRWLTDGTAAKLEKQRREDARQRQVIARAELAGLDYHAHPASYSGWLTLPEHARSDVIAHELAEHGIMVTTADAFATTAHAPNALRLALATPQLSELTAALRHVRTATT
ncbi:Putative transcriptional regulator%2C GntR family [Mycobacteroides abscessus]|uniref:Bacterial regulatory s, gntR family protein n=2 Tax=Mycobacteroides abscessus TaxID=36809 RepID=A0A829MFH6_9MYCO|nr:PLP-dependent aminotransferase family protein [Mycobacteroides abscessus]ESV56399.1 bacterial regulatory s, gntR family protein [Mycobacteroides abscessus MAB_082312_2258]ESV64805.1 bacterial regulatory s, gntR family protein [Mycobacteroides abscessus MAB_091912_2446]AMU27328.1 GntR family transcriptional regulator [Mycobacteroides abscessus]AMU37010.1 GntR family transcriptional regulator [Mycobacteroides abscessus]AMU42058.1 GntR family transcriptional regulator [Mycobacteroides abscessu